MVVKMPEREREKGLGVPIFSLRAHPNELSPSRSHLLRVLPPPNSATGGEPILNTWTFRELSRSKLYHLIILTTYIHTCDMYS
jgi:hypothetical protein